MADRPYKLTVSITSETPAPDGTVKVQQEVPVIEYSDTDAEHVLKNFYIAEAVTTATFKAMRELAESAGFVTGLGSVSKPSGQPKKK